MKLLPKLDSYHKTISKAREVLLIYCRAASAGASMNQIQADLGEGWVDRLEEALLGVSQQLAALSTRPRKGPSVCRCFKWRPGHLARKCRA